MSVYVGSGLLSMLVFCYFTEPTKSAYLNGILLGLVFVAGVIVAATVHYVINGRGLFAD